MRELFDFVAAFASVVGSSNSDDTKALFVDVSGIGSIDLDDPLSDDETGEVSPHAEAFGALGVLARPLSPEKIEGKDYACDVLCVRTSDGLVPVAWRDLRLNRAFPNGLPLGRVSLVGYGGGYHSLDLNDDGTNTQTFYIPYANGTKAMAITLDPIDEHISMAIGSALSGYQMTLNEEDGLQVRTPNQEVFFNVSENEITLAAPTITLKAGKIMMGAFNTTPVAGVNAMPVAYINPAAPGVPVPSTGVFMGIGV